MAKKAMKEATREKQDGKSAVSGEFLPEDTSLFDTHRPIPKVEGGDYTEDNTQVVLPTEHRDLHGNTPWLENPELIELRAIMEDYRTCVKLRVGVNNQKLAVERRMDEVTPEIEAMFEKVLADVEECEKYFKKAAEKQLEKVEMPIIAPLMGIKGVGPIIAAEIITLLNPHKAQYPSSFWSFVGFHKPAKDRYKKGVKGGGHKHLRSVMYLLAVSLLRAGNENYAPIYYRRKSKTENSELTVLHKNRRHEEYVETAWKDVNPGRRHNDALRVMVKNFLADLWFVWRTLEGLPTTPMYVEAHLGHTGIIKPAERGWGDEYK